MRQHVFHVGGDSRCANKGIPEWKKSNQRLKSIERDDKPTKLKINTASFAIGIGIGVVIAIAVSAVFLPRLGPQIYTTSQDTMTNSNRSHFFMSGIIKQISSESMVIDQAFGQPDYIDNANVTIRLDRGAVFVNCGYDIESCMKTITQEQMAKGLYVCAFTRMFNGEFYAGKMWLNSSCGPFQNEITNGSPEKQ